MAKQNSPVTTDKIKPTNANQNEENCKNDT